MPIARIEWHHQDKVNKAVHFRKVQEVIEEDGSELLVLAFESLPLFQDADDSSELYVLRKMAAGEDSPEFYSDAIPAEHQALALYDMIRAGVLI